MELAFYMTRFGCNCIKKRNDRKTDSYLTDVSAKYCYATHESRLHQNDRCKRFTLF